MNMKKFEDFIKEGAVASKEKTVTVRNKKSGKELVITASSLKKHEARGFELVK